MKKILHTCILFFALSGNAGAQALDPVLAGKLQSKIDSIRIAKNLKGISVCVLYPGAGIWKGASGISHSGNPVRPDMEFGIGSNTKLFTGVLLLKLAEKNIIRLDDSLHQYLPAFPNVSPDITIRQLLQHRSGLADIIEVQGYLDSILTNPLRVFTPAEVMTWTGPPLFSPGTGWSYSNTNYILAGMIAESATGKSYGQLLRDSILNPLQLDSTFLDVYDSVLFPVAHPWQTGTDNFSIPRKALNSAAWSAGAMYSTAPEMVHWYQALMHGQVLNAASFSEMTNFSVPGNYGTGLYSTSVLGRTVWQHSGTIWGGYNSSMVYDTTTGIIICVLINQLPAQAFQISVQLLSTLIAHPVGNHDQISQGDISIYPNPSETHIRIDIPAGKIRDIQIFNSTGRCMKDETGPEIEISDFPSGLYFLKLRTETGVFRKKFLKR